MHGCRENLGWGWSCGSDQNNMGTTLEPDPYERLKGGSPLTSGYSAGLKGHLGAAEEPWTWVALWHGLAPKENPLDLSTYKAMVFYARGDGKEYAVSLNRASADKNCSFKARFTAPKKWTKIRIPLEDFSPPNNCTDIGSGFPDTTSLSFGPILHEADFNFRVDDLAFAR